MYVRLDQIAPGDTVEAWVYTGSWGGADRNSPIYGLVQRVNRKTVSVVWAHSDRFQRVDPDNLTNVYKPDSPYAVRLAVPA